MSRTLLNQLNRAMGKDEQEGFEYLPGETIGESIVRAMAEAIKRVNAKDAPPPVDDRPLIGQFAGYGSHTMFDGPVSQDQDGKAWAVKDGGLVLDKVTAVTGDGEPVKRGTLTEAGGWQPKPVPVSWSPLTAVWHGAVYRWDEATWEWEKVSAVEREGQ